MAEAAIGAGVNIGEASFGALLDIKASIDTLGDLTRELLRQQEAYEEYGPVQLSLRAAGVSPAANDLVLNLGGPSYGRLWEVRRHEGRQCASHHHNPADSGLHRDA